MTKRSLDVGDQEGKVFEPPFEVAEKLETLPVSIMQLAIAVLASRCLNDTILIVLSFQSFLRSITLPISSTSKLRL